MGVEDTAQLLGFISHKKLKKVRKQIKNRRAQIDSPGYKGNKNTHFDLVGGGSKSQGWDYGFLQGKDPREGKPSKNRAPTTTKPRTPANPNSVTNPADLPQLTPGYQPGSLMDIIRPVGSFKMPGDRGDFGGGDDPITHRYRFHTGLDMSEAAGTPVYAAASGIVDKATPNGGAYGNQIILYHGDQKGKPGFGYDTMYGHLQMMLVKEGQKVAQGDKIGFVGSTGRSTGNHLHFETWENKVPVNPLKYLREKDRSDLKAAVAPKPAKAEPHKKGKKEKVIYLPQHYDREIIGMTKGEFDRSPHAKGDWVKHPEKAKKVKSVGSAPKEIAGKPDSELEAFLNAISTQESGGASNYGAVGVPTSSGRAYGKYQILDTNINGPGGWDEEALGRNVSIEEYLHNPQIQEEIARHKLSDYFKRYGASGAAKAWYGGEGAANRNSNSPQYGGPSINGYAASVLRHMQEFR